MLESTKQKYLKDAQGFMDRHFPSGVHTVDQVLYVLHKISHRYTAKSFSNLKAYLAFYYVEKGDADGAQRIREFKNRMAKTGNCNKPIKKIKTLSDDDLKAIVDAVRKPNKNLDNKQSVKKRKQLISAVWLAKELGARPCEMPHIRRTGITSFYITTAKKDEFGEQGIDREVSVESEVIADTLEKCVGYLRGVEMEQVAGRFKYLMEQLFPKRKKLPTLYVFRHILGSNLKSSDFYMVEMAYIMGHKSTRTIENYGYRQSGKGNVTIKPAVSLNKIQTLVRDNYEKRASERVKRVNNLAYQNNVNNTWNTSGDSYG